MHIRDAFPLHGRAVNAPVLHCLGHAFKGLAAAAAPSTDAEGLQWSLLEVWERTWEIGTRVRPRSARIHLCSLHKRALVGAFDNVLYGNKIRSFYATTVSLARQMLRRIRYATMARGSMRLECRSVRAHGHSSTATAYVLTWKCHMGHRSPRRTLM